MSNFGNHVLTDAGKSAEAEAHLPGKKLTFTKLAIGSGILANPSTATGLANHQMDLGITQVTRDPNNSNWVRIRSVFNNTTLTTGFNFQEIGVFARIDSDPEIMYSWARDLGIGDSIPSYDGANPVIIYPTVIVIIDSSIDIHADITIGADFDCENIGLASVGPGIYSHRQGNTFLFKRLVERDSIAIIDESDRIVIGQKTLELDLNLYVPLNHPNVTDPALAFPTIQAALDYLQPIAIPPDRTATIHVGTGRFPGFEVRHPNGSQIKIIGLEPVTYSVLGAGIITVVIANQYSDVTCALDRVHELAVGDYVTISGGSNYSVWGHWPITAIPTTNQITVRTRLRRNPTTGSILGATVWKWPSQVRSFVSAITIQTGLQLLKNFAIDPGAISTGRGITIDGNSRIEDIGICDYANCLLGNAESVDIIDSTISGANGIGLENRRGTATLEACLISGCYEATRAGNASTVILSRIVSNPGKPYTRTNVFGCTFGAEAVNGSLVLLGGVLTSRCSYGVVANRNGIVDTPTGNVANAFDIEAGLFCAWAQYGGQVILSFTTGVAAAQCIPTIALVSGTEWDSAVAAGTGFAQRDRSGAYIRWNATG